MEKLTALRTRRWRTTEPVRSVGVCGRAVLPNDVITAYVTQQTDFLSHTTMSGNIIPNATRVLVLEKSSEERTPVYHDAIIQERPIPELKDSEVLVRIGAVSLNHRDVRFQQSI